MITRANRLRTDAGRKALVLAALSAGLAGALIASAPALALSQRGHTFCQACSFGDTGEGALSDPGAVAVSRATGDVYVLDRAHGRIVQYGPSGQFLSAWGWDVKDGGKTGKEAEYEVCEAGECNTAGVSGRGKNQFNQNVMGLAVDNCTRPGGEACTTEEDPSVGDVYVLSELASAKEGREDEELEALTGERVFSLYAAIDKFAADGAALEQDLKRFRYAGGEGKEELEAESAHGLAVGPHGTPWLHYEEELFPISDVGLAAKEQAKGTEQRAPLSLSLEGEPAPGLALDARGRFYIPHVLSSATGEPQQQISEWQLLGGDGEEPELEELAPALDGEESTAVAANPLDLPGNEVDEQNDVYLTNVSGGPGNRSSTLAQFSPTGQLIQRLGAPGLTEGAGVAVDPATGAVYVTDAAKDEVDLFTLEEPGAPSIDSLSVSEVTAESAHLKAEIDTDAAPSTYYFEYGTAPCSSEPSACLRTPVPSASLGALFGEQGVQARLQAGTSAPLAPGTTYHYRVLASNAHGGSASAEATFTTLPQTSAAPLPDGRLWELVSPPEKDGAEVDLGSTFYSSAGGRLARAAGDGQALTYATDGPVGQAQGNRSFEPTQMLSVRGPDGWESQDIVTPSEHAEGIALGQGSEYRFFSSDLSLALVQPFNEASRTRLAEPPLSPPTSENERGHQEKTLYVRSDQPITPHGEMETQLYEQARSNGASMANPGFLALVTEANLPGVQFGSELPSAEPLKFTAATPDLTHVVITSEAPGAAGLYEWGAGTLTLINRLPEGNFSNPHTTYLGAEYPNVAHAISDDGSRVFWSTEQHLYLSDTSVVPEHTIQLDVVQPGASGEGTPDAIFQTASSDGSQVFFTDEQALTEGAGAVKGHPDLYVYDAVGGTLTDLTPPHGGEHADVRSLVLGASEQGCDHGQDDCYVYFVANGALSEAEGPHGEVATHGSCGVERYPDATCNLYVEHEGSAGQWAAPRFLARLSGEDQPDFQAQFEGARQNVMTSARVSPSGRYLAFMSNRSLTGYDNRDAATGERDEEVYLYQVGTQEASPGHLICASCDPSGSQPTGVLDEPTQESEAGAGLFVDRNGVWAGHRLAGSLPDWTLVTALRTDYQPRYLSDSGRLYFDSPDDLVPHASNAKEDVYEYEPPGVPSGSHQCSSSAASYVQPAEGCLGLVSSGNATGESAFLDASQTGGEGPTGEQLSEGGGDVFFATAAKLVPKDTDEAFDVYDAHECTTASPCIVPPEERPPEGCQSTEACRTYTPPGGSSLGAPASAGAGPSGNLAPQQAVLPSKTSAKPKPTRAQQLAKALKTCRSAHKHSRKKRLACEKRARKRYGPKARHSKAARTSKGARR